ncbi:hypothetical protein AB0H43_22300 [Hamadaea sp. NPDC050747]|uniref:hypothetical protein n=1 Tax=Hamadaea sp. NPDC050747 TaxID=3155789 RepID=UPI0033C5DE1C
MTNDETLRRFVLRARRVRAHSLVQNWDELIRYARGEFRGLLNLSGRMTMTRSLPQDEEIFESLVSRIRPLTVQSEPVYYVKVFDAIDQALGARDAAEARSKLSDLRAAWTAAEIQGVQTQAYALQTASVDGTNATNLVSDTQLAAAWLYADLVHADAKGPKREALAFPLAERYAAAVRVFSHMAALTVATLGLVDSLRDTGLIDIDASAWEDHVVVGMSELVHQGKVYVAPVGSETPDMRDGLAMGQHWSAFTVTDLLRQNPANHVRVDCRDQAGMTIASHEAAVSRRATTETSIEWDVLVAGSFMFTFSFDRQDEQITGAQLLRSSALNSTNELLLASTSFQLQLHHAAVIAFEVGGEQLLTLEPSTFPDDVRHDIEVTVQTVEDVVAIEHLSGQSLGLCGGQIDDRLRVRLRRARLIWEGQIVHAMRHPVTVTTTDGNPPALIIVAPGTLNIGDAEVPIPQTLMRHPGMTATEIRAAPTAGPDAKTFLMAPPTGEQFLAWSPQHVHVANDDDLVATAPWNLIGIDEETFGY